ncbi:MAG: hypothetical protein JNK63_03560 [Chthonomonas sp.]|nr:hypothetical protein [Chthonomonas sp.]
MPRTLMIIRYRSLPLVAGLVATAIPGLANATNDGWRMTAGFFSGPAGFSGNTSVTQAARSSYVLGDVVTVHAGTVDGSGTLASAKKVRLKHANYPTLYHEFGLTNSYGPVTPGTRTAASTLKGCFILNGSTWTLEYVNDVALVGGVYPEEATTTGIDFQLSGIPVGSPVQTGRFYIYQCYATGTQTTLTALGGAQDADVPAYTTAIYDDVTPMPGYAGQQITAVNWATRTGAAATFQSLIRFHLQGTGTPGPTGVFDPGTWLTGHTYVSSHTAGSFVWRTGVSTAFPTVPTDQTFWMGQQYNNGGATTATTAAQLNGIGAVYANPHVGSSTHNLWRSTAPGTSTAVSGPVGTQGAVSPSRISNIALGIAVQGQDFVGTVNLQDVGAMAYQRAITYQVFSGVMPITHGGLLVGTASTSSSVRVILPNVPPAGATNQYTIVFDGASFLKKTVNVTVPGSATPTDINIGAVALVNGDVDTSGEVDAADIDQVIADFGAIWPVGNGNPNSDVDVSGEVDAGDIDIIIANFGAIDE